MRFLIEAMRKIPGLNSGVFAAMVVALCRGPVARLVRAVESRRLRKLRSADRILVISDTNIGDSILLKAALRVFAVRLPHAEIDYAYHHKVVDLVAPDPVVARSIPLPGGGIPGAERSAEVLRQRTADRSYDFVLNFCPFFTDRQIGHPEAKILAPASLAASILRAAGGRSVASLQKHVVDFVEGVVDDLPGALPAASAAAEKPRSLVFLSEAHRSSARAFVEDNGWNRSSALVFVNPDASNDSTRVAPSLFVELCELLAASTRVDGVIIGCGFTYRNVEREVMDRLGDQARAKCRVLPSDMSLADFAALCDWCSVYVGADTGPLHIAAAHKAPAQPGRPLRNRTVVVGLFKATEPRIYGYASNRDDMIDTAQNAESTFFEGRPDCKNLTCSLQRLTATCPAIECGELLVPKAIANFVVAAIERRAFQGPSDGAGAGHGGAGSTIAAS
jgi:hypothetical protein